MSRCAEREVKAVATLSPSGGVVSLLFFTIFDNGEGPFSNKKAHGFTHVCWKHAGFFSSTHLPRDQDETPHEDEEKPRHAPTPW